jgi:hypothetical protein
MRSIARMRRTKRLLSKKKAAPLLMEKFFLFFFLMEMCELVASIQGLETIPSLYTYPLY